MASRVYSTSAIDPSKYKILRVLPQEGTSVTFTASGGNTSTFSIPINEVFNFSKSWIQYTRSIAAGGATMYHWLDKLGWTDIDRITLRPASGVPLIDLQYVNNYTNCIFPHYVSMQTLHEQPRGGCLAQVAIDLCTGLRETNAVVDGDGPTDYAQYMSTTDATAATGVVANSYINYTDIQSLEVNSAVNNIDVRRQVLPLGMLFHSLFAQNLDMPSCDQLYLTITWAPHTKFVHDGTDPDDGGIAGPVQATTGACTATLVELDMAIIKDQQQKTDIIQKFKGGIEIPCDFVNAGLINTPAGAVHSLQIRPSIIHGSRLKRILYAPFNATQTLQFAYVHGNELDRFAELQTATMDADQLYEKTLDMSAGDGYLRKKEALKGSAIQTMSQWLRFFMWVESWDDESVKLDQSIVQGLPLAVGQREYQAQWGVNATGAVNWYYWIVGQKILKMKYNEMGAGEATLF